MYIKRYTSDKKEKWDNFLQSAKNGHFFFYRDYMEYHSDRFKDFSLIFYDDKDRILGLLPANISGNEVITHGGLTFGGIIVDVNMTVAKMLNMFEKLKVYLHNAGVTALVYKCMPYIYNTYPADEALYALFLNKATLYRRDVSFSICLKNRLKYQEQRKRAIKKGYNNKYDLQESNKYAEYIQLMDEILSKYHATHPVHTAAELQLLAERFPNNIKLYTAEKEGKIVAGTVFFLQAGVVHTQYLANSDEGKKNGALDCLLDWLINDVYKDKVWFDFGIANEQQGWYLNGGLAAQKEGFGARAIVHDFYRLDV